MNLNNFIIKIMRHLIQHYSPKKYWSRRTIVVDPNSKCPLWLKYYYLYYIKKADAYNCASFATYINEGAQFLSPPILPPGLNGIVIAADTVIGHNCTLCQQITIQAGGGGVNIGDNCFIGAGARILKGVRIGNNVKIGANAVVTENLPDNVTVVPQKSRIIIK